MGISIFWFRRDLRFEDNTALFHAFQRGQKVQCVFFFDTFILDKLEQKEDARVTFLHDTLIQLDQTLRGLGGFLDVRYGNPVELWPQLLIEYPVSAVYANRDYEPYAIGRDQQVADICDSAGVEFVQYKDHVIFEKSEVVKADGSPYTVFTPYKRRWLEALHASADEKGVPLAFATFPSLEYLRRENIQPANPEVVAMIGLEAMGFRQSTITIPPKEVAQSIILRYDMQRDFPSVEGTSRLGIHFRFGTISIRQKAHKASGMNATFLSELIWRDFYSMILFHFPHVATASFRPEYDGIAWRNDEKEFEAWCEGKTGYPIVDAGMRQLKATGYMHNRVRMIVASFLTKHLLIDWRWGEAWFASQLLDFDLASNNGGWQWAAGCGTDAAPYFRVFSPDAQTDKFDKDKRYIRQWVKEFGTDAYPEPIVDHKFARERCLQVYKTALELGRK